MTGRTYTPSRPTTHAPATTVVAPDDPLREPWELTDGERHNDRHDSDLERLDRLNAMGEPWEMTWTLPEWAR